MSIVTQASDVAPDPRDVAAAMAEADRITASSAASLSWLRWHGHAEYEHGFRDGSSARLPTWRTPGTRSPAG